VQINIVEARRAGCTTVSEEVALGELEEKEITLRAPGVILGSLRVESEPMGAAVFVDGKQYDETPCLLGESAGLAVGTHEVKLTKEGFSDYTASVTLKENEETVLSGIRLSAIEKKETPPKGNTRRAVSGENGGHIYVDLGLPSGTLWATTNIGAESPEEYGDYYAWGETSTKDIYSWKSYKWCDGSDYEWDNDNETTLTKYNTKRSYGRIDKQMTLNAEDDAATQNWGKNWRTPTDEEWKELSGSYCTWMWVTKNGVEGYLVGSKVNGSQLFLPAGGYMNNESLLAENEYGYYWSSEMEKNSPDKAWSQYITPSGTRRLSRLKKAGFTIRPVYVPNQNNSDETEGVQLTNDALDSYNAPLGSIKVQSKPSGADVIADGNIIGRTPAVIALPVGDIALTFKKNGYDEQTTHVMIEEGKTTSVSMILKQKMISIKFPSSGGSETIKVVVTEPWAAFSDFSWLFLSPKSGEENGPLTITASENKSSSTREGEIVIRSGESKIYVSVVQDGQMEMTDSSSVQTNDRNTYVDLGLPSGILWATSNVGASSPEEFGSYFAWGETVAKNDYSWSTYKWYNGSSNALTKYNADATKGVIDNLTSLEPNDDAAAINMKGGWRMPTNKEWGELCDTSNCSWIWTDRHGVKGYMVNSKKNGESVFFPAAGYRSSTGRVGAGSGGFYRSSYNKGIPNDAWGINFDSTNVRTISSRRYLGYSVRAVRHP